MSLKRDLHAIIKSLGECSYNYLEKYCGERGYRVSNMERRLRQSESPQVFTVYNLKGHIIGYKWIKKEEQLSWK